MPVEILSNSQAQIGVTYQTTTFDLDHAANEIVTNDKLSSFADLCVGWHYGQGIPPSMNLISRLIEINRQAYRFGFSKTDAFPGVSGNIMLTLYEGEYLVDLTVERDGKTATFTLEKNYEELDSRENIALSTAIELMKKVGEICQSSELSTLGITRRRSAGLRVQPSKALTTGEYRFFPQTAPFAYLGPSANTSMYITFQSTSQAFQQFTGNSMKEFYPVYAIAK